MNIQQLVRDTLSSQTETLGGETITIAGVDVLAVLAETDTEREIFGGSRVQRGLTAQFSTNDTLDIREGSEVTTRSETWKIETVRKGQAMTSIDIIEPNRPAES
jgi:hypothetical protein